MIVLARYLTGVMYRGGIKYSKWKCVNKGFLIDVTIGDETYQLKPKEFAMLKPKHQEYLHTIMAEV